MPAMISQPAAIRKPTAASVKLFEPISLPKSAGPMMPPSPGADRVEERDRERANLEREDLADRQVGGAGGCGREEEDDAPQDGQRHRRQCLLLEEDGGDEQHASCSEVRQREHRSPADLVEQRSEQDGTEEVADRERHDVEADVRLVRVHEGRQHEPVREEDRVVGEGLRATSSSARARCGRVVLEQHTRNRREPRRLARMDLDLVARLVQLARPSPSRRGARSRRRSPPPRRCGRGSSASAGSPGERVA